MGKMGWRGMETRGYSPAERILLSNLARTSSKRGRTLLSDPTPPKAPYTKADVKVSRRNAIKDSTVGNSNKAISSRTFVATAVSAMTALRSLRSITGFGARPGVERSMSDMPNKTVCLNQRKRRVTRIQGNVPTGRAMKFGIVLPA
jgi:hypothetical protein